MRTVWISVAALLCALAFPTPAQSPTAPLPIPIPPQPGVLPASADTIQAVSQSGQFVVTGPRITVSAPITTRGTSNPQRDLTPQTLAVSCERVKMELLRILDLPDAWRAAGGRIGRIFVNIEPRAVSTNNLSVQAAPFEGGWHFRLPVPPTVSEDRLVRVLTHGLLMELASRNGGNRAGEPPLWLVEGLTQQILNAVPDGIVLQPQTRLVGDLRLGESLSRVRHQLMREAPPSFLDLSQPDFSRMQAAEWNRFSASSHLLTYELVRLPDGRARLCRWLFSMQKHWNWQTGFLEAFTPIFRSLLDVEKWWAITMANFSGRNASQTWSPEFALRKLEEALQPMGVMPGAGNRATRLSVHEVVTSWEYQRQVPVLRQVLQQLAAIRVNAPPAMTPLVYRYAEVIEDYLAQRSRIGFSPTGRGQVMTSAKLLARETVNTLKSLDQERSNFVVPVPPATEPGPGT